MTIEVIIMVVVGIVVLGILGALIRVIGDILADAIEIFCIGFKGAVIAATVVSLVYFAHYLMA